MLFIDARKLFRQIDRAHRDFTDEQLEFLANIVRLYRGEEPEFDARRGRAASTINFPEGTYRDVTGLCKVATVAEIEAQGWSLNPGRYVGTEVVELDDEVFEERLAAAQLELRELGARAAELEAGVDHVLTQLLRRDHDVSVTVGPRLSRIAATNVRDVSWVAIQIATRRPFGEARRTVGRFGYVAYFPAAIPRRIELPAGSFGCSVRPKPRSGDSTGSAGCCRTRIC